MATPPMCTFVGGMALTLFTLELTALAPGPAAAGDRAKRLSGLFRRASTGPLISSEPDADHPIVPEKDPRVLRYRNRRPVCRTTANTVDAWSLGGSGTCPMLVEAPPIGSDGRCCFRTRTADLPGGTWTPSADTGTNACTPLRDVTFQDAAPTRTKGVSRGEMIRDGVDQIFTIDPCRLRRPHRDLHPSAKPAPTPNPPGESRC